MLFDEEDASLLKKWIVKRLEDISDADSDVLADYVLALLRHDHQSRDEVKALCIEQLEDFLREHTGQFVDDVFTALLTKAFRSVNSTLVGGGLSVTMPAARQETPPAEPMEMESTSPPIHKDRLARAGKRSYYDCDEPEEDDRSRSFGPRDRKMPRRGGAGGAAVPFGWNGRGGAEAGRGGFRGPATSASGMQFGIPPAAPGFQAPWMPPNPNDPMAAYLAAQAAATWGGFQPDGKMSEKKEIVKKVGERCKDYDEKGFCMKGDMCPYEHGVDHIVVPGQDGKSEGIQENLFGGFPQLIKLEYDPNDSMLFSSSSAERNGRGGRGGSRGRGGHRGGRGGRGGRSEFAATGPNWDRKGTKLVVEQIPDDKLDEKSIKEFFGMFGTLETVEIHPHKSLAILQFTSWEMAKAAYDSPAPIFDNRFVKVFWYRPSDEDSADPENGVAPTPSNDEEKIDIEEVKRKQEELQRIHEEKMAKKRAMEERAKDLQKKQEELLKQQQEELRKLKEKLAKKHAKKSSIAPSPSPAPDGTPDLNSKPVDPETAALKAQLEALEAEADALGIDHSQQEEGFDLGAFRGRGRGRGRFATAGRGYVPRGRGGYSTTFRGRGGAYAPRGRGGIPTMKLDNRTKRVAVTIPDMQGDKEEEFRHYLINNGIELEAIESHPEKSDTKIFVFQDRRNAEKFVFSGNDIPEVGTVSLAWFNAPLPPVSVPKQELDTDMMDAGASDSYHHHQNNDDSYDLAEDDEGRWLPE
ncbi:Similar to Uncharacterized RNA-binding protein C902.04; acc. no. Q9USP9 [Pyronema omphalodes CBS 100304]|uniref:Similar to Uncharacterized RNA-binding protein C902.04 acc. no. Q9USP9 n=1 Tax=Pyronema omphalodes (strain CBS 100304) TaxID=1076935 RepID=U4LFS6_PYROM|nr:Similar to Uncharacterized RNA-binding protein C902.04; acc. no. Q9USP9 [Pyronema omphalodes CBS 100304]